LNDGPTHGPGVCCEVPGGGLATGGPIDGGMVGGRNGGLPPGPGFQVGPGCCPGGVPIGKSPSLAFVHVEGSGRREPPCVHQAHGFRSCSVPGCDAVCCGSVPGANGGGVGVYMTQYPP